VCLHTEEELKRLNEALADDNSYSAVSFDYDTSDKTAEQSSTAETSHGKFTRRLLCPHLWISRCAAHLDELFRLKLFSLCSVTL